MLKREPSVLIYSNKEIKLAKSFYTKKENTLYISSHNSQYEINVILPYDGLLKKCDFITYLINKIQREEPVEENHKIVYLNIKEINKIISITSKKNNIFNFRSGKIELRNWDDNPTIFAKLQMIDFNNIELYLFPILNEKLDFKTNSIEYLMNDQNPLSISNEKQIKNLEDLVLFDFEKNPVWSFDLSKEEDRENVVIPSKEVDPFKLEDSIVHGLVNIDGIKIDVLCFICNVKTHEIQHLESFDEIHDKHLEKFLTLLRKEKRSKIKICGDEYDLIFTNGTIFIDKY